MSSGGDGSDPTGPSGAEGTPGDAPGDASGGNGRKGQGEDGGSRSSESSPREVTRKPTTLSGGLALLSATVVMVLGGLNSVLGFGLGALGLAALAPAVVTGSRSAADVGGVLLLFSVVLTGTTAGEVTVLAAAVATVLAWDLATNAIEMGEQMGREADTERAELVHAGTTLAVGVVTGGVAIAAFNLATGGQPATALVLLLLAALALASALRL